jgi:SAM-dependent methyltransferase
MSTTYYFDEAWPEERARLAALEVALDPGTIELLQSIGVDSGATCLEVGAGGGSITDWLCRQVGPHGHVLACDVQTKFVAALDHPQLEVRRHDIGVDELPEGSFDLAHARWTLFWLSPPNRAAAIERMLRALKPGGRILVEEPDFLTLLESPLPEPLRTVIIEHVRLITDISGSDVTYGRQVFHDLRAAGVADLRSQGRTHIIQPGLQATGAPWLRFALDRLQHQLIDADAISPEAFAEAMLQFDRPGSGIWFPITMAVWGTAPPRC